MPRIACFDELVTWNIPIKAADEWHLTSSVRVYYLGECVWSLGGGGGGGGKCDKVYVVSDWNCVWMEGDLVVKPIADFEFFTG